MECVSSSPPPYQTVVERQQRFEELKTAVLVAAVEMGTNFNVQIAVIVTGDHGPLFQYCNNEDIYSVLELAKPWKNVRDRASSESHLSPQKSTAYMDPVAYPVEHTPAHQSEQGPDQQYPSANESEVDAQDFDDFDRRIAVTSRSALNSLHETDAPNVQAELENFLRCGDLQRLSVSSTSSGLDFGAPLKSAVNHSFSSHSFNFVKRFLTMPYLPQLTSDSIRAENFGELSGNLFFRIFQGFTGYFTNRRQEAIREFRCILDCVIADDRSSDVYKRYNHIIDDLRGVQHTEKDLILKLARGIARSIEKLKDPMDLRCALAEHEFSSPIYHDWSDHDLGESMVIANLPVAQILPDGPRLVNTSINGIIFPLFDEIEDPQERSRMWLKSALTLIHQQIMMAVGKLDGSDNERSHDAYRSFVPDPDVIDLKVEMIIASQDPEAVQDPSLTQDVDIYILKCLSQYGDNQFFGKFRQIFPDTEDIFSTFSSKGRERRVHIVPKSIAPVRLQHVLNKAKTKRVPITDLLDIQIERLCSANLGLLEEDMACKAIVPLRLIQHIHWSSSGDFESRGLLQSSAPCFIDASPAVQAAILTRLSLVRHQSTELVA